MENSNNLDIPQLIKSLPEDSFATKEQIAYFQQYDACDDYLLSNALINKIWAWFKNRLANYSPIGDTDIPASVSILHTNSGAGKILSKAPDNSTIFAYNMDYVCKRICDFVCQEKEREGKYFSFFRDISQYFVVCNTDSSRKYSIVITQPSSKLKAYKGIDCVGDEESCEPLEYYVRKSMHFVEKGGYLVVVYEPKDSDKLKDIIDKTNSTLESQITIPELKYIAYEAVILRKNDTKTDFAKGGALEKEFKFDKNFVIYVPSTSDVGKKISKKELDARVDEVEKYVANLFGGYTETETDGGYKSTTGEIIEEDIVKVSVFANNKDWKKNEKNVVSKVKDWAKRWGQEAIGFEYEGDLYYIDDDGKFAKGGETKNYPTRYLTKNYGYKGKPGTKLVVKAIEDDIIIAQPQIKLKKWQREDMYAKKNKGFEYLIEDTEVRDMSGWKQYPKKVPNHPDAFVISTYKFEDKGGVGYIVSREVYTQRRKVGLGKEYLVKRWYVSQSPHYFEDAESFKTKKEAIEYIESFFNK